MKSFRQTQSALHTWTGLLVGWVLFLIFIAGTASFWREEISRWMRPELTTTSEMRTPEDERRMVEGALTALAARAPDATSWSISLPGQRGVGVQGVWTERLMPGEPRRPFRWPDASNSLWVDGDGKVVAVRETRGGDFWYRLHFDLHYMPVIWARWFVGFCSMFMLIAIVTGVITHKKIFREFFTFRPGKGQRSWLDGHNATAVLALPFHLMITYTGLVTLMTLYMPWGLLANFDDRNAAFTATQPNVPPAKYAATPAPMAPMGAMLDQARQVWGGGGPGSIRISNPGDASARVTMGRDLSHSILDDGEPLVFDGVTGALLGQAPAGGAGTATRDAMVGIHAGRFSPITVRWLYFLSGLAGTVMVGTGLVMWTAKRREKLLDPARPHVGFRLVERLNVGTVAGLPLGMVTMLCANRLLPVGMEGRWQGEVNAMFIAWGLALAYAFLRPPKRGWVEQFGLTGAALVALPIFDQFSGQGMWQHLTQGDATRFWTDITFIALGLSLAAIAVKVHRHKPRMAPAKARAPKEAAMAVAGE
ncbi:PepSY-associated TM helix domain-containing protein [Niveispirillum sp. KHB5.9]|uniref:PepSY-associated TM helix domain-containing protein n=1 Tax=Niveispirillum sp. KHB5.9 TaxID=3400269 RepID=UPI003A89ADBA